MNPGYLTVLGLALIMALVLFLPFSVRKVEEELEAFLLLMGFAAVTVSGVWSCGLVWEALRAPVPIALAVLGAGFVFRAARPRIAALVEKMVAAFGLKAAVFLIVVALGLVSSVITAIVAALALSEIITVLKLERKCEVRLVALACLSIGLGAALTPTGEPLAAIIVAKLKGPPHHADIFYLWNLLWPWVLPGVAGTGLIAAAIASGQQDSRAAGLRVHGTETDGIIALRALKVYLFVAALALLGAGLAPLAEMTAAKMRPGGIYWLNMVSAVLDNATLAAAEITPSMPEETIRALLLGLLISGCMLVPGNIPNIVSAAKLNIKSREWAAFAVPLGLAIMLVYFIILEVLA
ncbi:MAG: DUF1646 family protein [Elusimicrobiales bacterium]|nr:DUF1646 family protein [Elusimicrobiales bacterium]